MIHDMHYHLAPHALRANLPSGCIVSQDSGDNQRYFAVAEDEHVLCALLADPEAKDVATVLSLISQKRALAYKHLERIGIQRLQASFPTFEASRTAGLPIIVHVSHHSPDKFPSDDARECLSTVISSFPDLLLIISHSGGENARAVIDLAEKHQTIYLDLSRLSETAKRAGYRSADDLLMTLASRVGSERLLYGSDRSWPAEDEEVGILTSLRDQFDDSAVDCICRRNAERLLPSLASKIS